MASEFPRNAVYSRLNAGPATTPSLLVVLRLFGIQILRRLVPWTGITEEKKIAIYRSRRIAVIHSLLHLVPLGSSIVLILSNCLGVIVSDGQPKYLTELQFAAKLMELLMQASISMIVFSSIRSAILDAESFPFGGLIGAFRVKDPAYLWSMEFWALLTSPNIENSRKFIVWLLLPFSIILAALVGPSSAVLMIPRLIKWKMSHDLLLIGDLNEVYPTYLSFREGDQSLFPDLNMTVPQLTMGTHLSQTIQITDNSGLRDFQAYIGGFNDTFSLYSFTVATQLSTTAIPGALVAMDGSYTPESSVTLARTFQPYLEFQCWYEQNMTVTNLEGEYVYFGPADPALNNVISFDTFVSNLSVPENENFTRSGPWFQNSTGNGMEVSVSAIVWQIPPEGVAHSLLMAEASSTSGFTDWEGSTACTIDAYWVDSTMRYDTNNVVMVNQDINQTLKNTATRRLTVLAPRLAKASYELMEAVGLDYGDANLDYFPTLTLVISNLPQPKDMDLNADFARFDKSDGKIHNASSLASESQVQDFTRYIRSNHFQSIYDNVMLPAVAENWTMPTDFATIVLDRSKVVWGYNNAAITVQLSVVVVSFYVLFVLVYLVITLTTGETGSSWESIGEIITLALNSERPKDMENTSVGIDAMETYRRPLNIRINETESAEIVFDGDGGKDDVVNQIRYRRISPNEKY